MSRIFITGDTHGTIDFHKLNTKNFPIQKELNKNDIVIICGDGGLVWSGNTDDQWLQKWYEDKNFTTLIVDGNHENHDLIAKLPIIEKFGGKVHQISNSVFYAIRGEIYEFNNKRFLTCGGADSHDIGYRQEGISWWRKEQISLDDLYNAIRNLEKYNCEVDYIISHTGGSEVCRNLAFKPTVSDFKLDSILDITIYKHHYMGHYHLDKLINKKTRILYNDIIEIEAN